MRSVRGLILVLVLGVLGWGTPAFLITSDYESADVQTDVSSKEVANVFSRQSEKETAPRSERDNRPGVGSPGGHASTIPVSAPKRAGRDLLHLLTLQRE